MDVPYIMVIFGHPCVDIGLINSWNQWEYGTSHMALDIPTPPKSIFDDIKHAFLAKEWNSFHLTWKKLDYRTSKILSIVNVNCTWSNHWHHPNTRALLITTPQIIDLPLKLVGGWHSQFIGIKDYVNLILKMQLKTRYTWYWNVPSTTPLE
jgi:hypothetical protein